MAMWDSVSSSLIPVTKCVSKTTGGRKGLFGLAVHSAMVAASALERMLSSQFPSQAGTPAGGMLVPTVRWGFLLQLNLSGSTLPDISKAAFPGWFLNPVKLTVTMNHCRGLPGEAPAGTRS